MIKLRYSLISTQGIILGTGSFNRRYFYANSQAPGPAPAYFHLLHGSGCEWRVTSTMVTIGRGINTGDSCTHGVHEFSSHVRKFVFHIRRLVWLDAALTDW